MEVPAEALESMPGFEDQARMSINQAVFLRALKHYFEAKKLNAVRADMVLERMQSYLTDSRQADERHESPLLAMYNTILKRVPPKNEVQEEQYAARVEKIYDYVSGLVEKGLLKRYEVTS